MGEPERRDASEARRTGAEGLPYSSARLQPPHRAASPDPEVSARHARRRFTTKYKLEILRKADACTQPGQVGALLRKEGLYFLASRHMAPGTSGRADPEEAGRKATPVDPKVKKLEQENRRLERRLQKAEAIIAFQKKVYELLGIPLKPFESDEDD